ncbi:hypothetical protein HYW75_05835 [Candidatus Pacearchaeota archaeon]|nr:hypothetical protein [Candidatus Pacearchaeota archaeon]
MSDTYIVYTRLNIEGDKRTVIITASNNTLFFLSKFPERITYSVRDSSPLSLIRSLEREIEAIRPKISPTNRIDKLLNPYFKQLKFTLSLEVEAQLFDTYRKFAKSVQN